MIGELREIIVKLTDSPKVPRSQQTHDFVCFRVEDQIGGRRCDSDRDNDAGRPRFADCRNCRPHRRTSCDPVIDKNYVVPSDG